jgi:DNA-binding response OmpR family regulator
MPTRIMVLEDEQVLVELLQDLLSLEGYEVVTLKDANFPLEEMRQNQPDAILMDVNLKGMNGLDLLAKIRGDSQLKYKTVVMTSGLDLREESLARGATHFLMKPYMPDELIGILKDKIAR